jgi:uncharacterized protein (TIGR03089 family)
MDRPLLTYRDDATGERVDMNAYELGKLTSRTASLLRDGLGLTAGEPVAVLLPAHWTTAAIVLGAWSLGLTVSFQGWGTAGLSPQERVYGAVFVSKQRAESWLERVPESANRYVVGGDSPGYLSYESEVKRYADAVPDYKAVRPTDAGSPDGTTFGSWTDIARELAERMGLGRGDRILVDAGADEQVVKWLLAPLTVGASIVVAANLDPSILDDVVAREGVTRVL